MFVLIRYFFPLKERDKNLPILSHLLKEAHNYCETGGEILQEELIMDDLRDFTNDAELENDLKIKVLKIAQAVIVEII